MPRRPWLMRQSWHHVLFAHWAVEPEVLRQLVPPEMRLDLAEGMAWLGVVPFDTSAARPRGLPPLPGVSHFPELNVRTYVRVGDRAGVYFFSLDAGSRVAVRVARWALRLPYYDAAMHVAPGEAGVTYRSRRRGAAAVVELDVRYAPCGEPYYAPPRTLDHFLIERYCLFACNHQGRPYRLEIHHPPWALQAATASFRSNTMADPLGVELVGRPLLHYAARQDMLAWRPTAP